MSDSSCVGPSIPSLPFMCLFVPVKWTARLLSQGSDLYISRKLDFNCIDPNLGSKSSAHCDSIPHCCSSTQKQRHSQGKDKSLDDDFEGPRVAPGSHECFTWDVLGPSQSLLLQRQRPRPAAYFSFPPFPRTEPVGLTTPELQLVQDQK